MWIFPFGILLLILQLRPIDDSDLLTQIRLGSQLPFVVEGAISQRFLYTSVQVSEHVGWLGQIVLAQLDSIGGLLLVRLVGTAFLAAAFVLAARRSNEVLSWSVIVALLLGVLVSASSTSIRPQVVAFFCFSVVQLLLGKAINLRRGMALAALLIGWQNVHPSVMVAGAPAAVYLLKDTLERKLSMRSFVPGLLVVMSSVATPDGTHLFSVSAANLFISRTVLQISEWLPPWNSSVADAMSGFWLAVGVSAFMFIRGRRCLPPLELLQPLALLAATLASARFAPFWALSMIPVWTKLLESAFPSLLGRSAHRPFAEMRPSLIVASLAVALLPAFCAYRPMSQSLRRDTSKAISEYSGVKRVYNYYAAAGPLVYFAPNRFELLVDGRLYLFSKEFWNRYGREANGEVSLDEILIRDQPDAFLLYKPFQKNLATLLSADPRFKRVFENESDVVYVRE